jgi:glycine oxidase
LLLLKPLCKIKKKIVVIDNNQNASSKVAGGLYNPVILKRFTAVWNAQEQLVNIR